MKSLVLLSGGLDSAVALASALKQGAVLLALTFDYGQFSAKREIEAASQIARFYALRHEIIKLDWLQKLGGSALTDKTKEIPRVSEADLASPLEINFEHAKAVWVPNRNAVFLSLAAAYAEKYRADLIIAGFNAEEATTFSDNSLPFVNLFNQLLRLSTQTKPRVLSPTQTFNKMGVVTLGKKLGAPFHLIYSCYRGRPKMCGRCESCARLQRAFKSTGNWGIIKDKFKAEKDEK